MSSYPRLREKQEQEDLVNLHTWKALECAELRNHTSKDRSTLNTQTKKYKYDRVWKDFSAQIYFTTKGLANVILAF